jgi:hypothetical protein
MNHFILKFNISLLSFFIFTLGFTPNSITFLLLYCHISTTSSIQHCMITLFSFPKDYYFFVANFKCALFCPIFCHLSCHNEVFQSILFVQFLHILLKIRDSSFILFYKIELNFAFLISRVTLITKLK